jgi:E3 ubiquitin-protein transferase RMND5
MEELRKEHAKVERKGNFDQTLKDVQSILDMLTEAKESLASSIDCPHLAIPAPPTNLIPDPSAAPLALAKLKGPLKSSFDKLNDDLKVVHGALNSYSKVLNKVRSNHS